MSRAVAAGGRPAAVRAEWRKLWSVRSTAWTMIAATACAVALGLLDALGALRGWDAATPADRTAFDAVGTSLGGLTFAQLAFAVLGVLAVTGDYGTGTIDPTLLAVPRRGRVFAAKVCAVGGLALVAGQILAVGTFLAGQAVLSRRGLQVTLGEPGVLRAVTGAGLLLAATTLIGLGLGGLLRRSAAGLAAVVAVIFLAYAAARAVEGWSYLPARLVLSNAEDVIAQVHATAAAPRLPSLGAAYLDVAGYVLTTLTLGAWRARRDP